MANEKFNSGTRNLTHPATHRCHADDCKVEIARHQAFCAEHDALVPNDIKQRIWRAYKPTLDHSHAYILAVDEAVEAIRHVLGIIVIDPPAGDDPDDSGGGRRMVA